MIQKDAYQTQSSTISLHNIPADEIKKLTIELKDSTVEFCRKLIKTPSIYGNEKLLQIYISKK